MRELFSKATLEEWRKSHADEPSRPEDNGGVELTREIRSGGTRAR
jgi:hypothetical protein